MTDEDDPYTEEKRGMLEAALIEADFDGFSLETLRRAADKAGVAREMQRLAFPRGVMDLVAYYSLTADAAMLEGLKAHDLAAMKVREKIALAVRLRIEALSAHKPAARRAVQFLTLPQFAPEGLRNLYRTVDAIWRGIGDTSTDFNFYTKRVLLAGVYTTTLMRWFEDQSDRFACHLGLSGRTHRECDADRKGEGRRPQSVRAHTFALRCVAPSARARPRRSALGA